VTDPVVWLDVDRVAVEPGGQASVTVKITNPGSIVEGYLVEVVGEGVSEWADVLPPEVSVYPQQDANAVIVFSPPSGTGAPGGVWPFGIRVRSTEDPNASAVVEGDLDIGKVFGLQAKLLPVNSSGRWRGVHVLQVSNWGNAPVTLRLSASNPDQALGFMIRPDAIEVPLGAVATARVWAKTKSPYLRGTPTRIPFTVTGEIEGAPVQRGPVPQYGGTPDRPSVDGAFNQKPILSRGTVMVATLALMAAAGAVAWSLTRPGPEPANFEAFGPPAPQDVKVEPVAPETVQVTWAQVLNVDGYTVAQVLENGSRTGSVPVPALETATTIGGLTPGTRVCFAVLAQRGEWPGPLSQQGCADLPAATPTAAPSTALPSPTEPASPTSPDETSPPETTGSSGGGGGTGGGRASPTAPAPGLKGTWVAAALLPVNFTPKPDDKLRELSELDKTARLVRSTQYPNMSPRLTMESWVLYLGPYASRSQADASCDIVRQVLPTNCVPLQLDP
jgi:Fibronectin type III domain